MPIRTLAIACLLTIVPAHGRAAGTPLLDVPFVPQSEALCGGAAAAMVLRYWHATGVHAEDFAALVSDTAAGITLGDLTRAIRDRGWRAWPSAGSASDVRGHLARGRPVIALIEDRPGRNHYVVVVAWAESGVVFHDPARGPFRVADATTFDRAWTATGRTTLLVVPADENAALAGPRDAPDRAPLPPAGQAGACREPLARGIALARAGDVAGGETLLSVVRESCATLSAGPRELAGIRFLQERWMDAAALAEEAVSREPTDLHAWQLLATARFLAEDPAGALTAWNRRNEPRVDLTRIDGLTRTQYDVVAGLVNLPPRTVLTASHLARAARRVAALPAVGGSRVSYTPTANGLATVDVAVVEHPLVATSRARLLAAALGAATTREASLDVASPTGNGELWTMTGRWWEGRPRVAFSLAAPRLGPWSGLWRLDGSWERQTYRAPDADRLASDRRRAAIAFADWGSGAFRWEVGGALDHWADRGNLVSATAAVEGRLWIDRLALRVDGSAWPRRRGAAGFGSGSLSAAARSTREAGPRWTGQAGLHLVSAAAPLDLWPGAGTGVARAPLLRAHPLLADGAVRAERLGQILMHATLEHRRPVVSRGLAQFDVAAFADVARLGFARGIAGPRTDVDLGVGVRVGIAGAPGGLRLDLARGLRDGGMAVSAAWLRAWPGW